MRTKFIEVTGLGPNGQPFNWGKFMVGCFDGEEWRRRSTVEPAPILSGRGWTFKHLLVMDLQTGEGAAFKHGGLASSDLNDKHQIWVCPMFEPFLTWLYKQSVEDIDALPSHITLTHEEAPGALAGYRRDGAKKEG